MKKALETEALDAPRLVVLVEDDEVVECVVVGDNKYILCHSTSITSSLLDLLIVYYVTDLSYPRQYSQLLGLLQQYVLKEDTSKLKTSTKYVKFMHQLNEILG